MLSFRKGHTPQVVGFIPHTLFCKSLGPKLNLLNNQEIRTVFPLCDLQGGSSLQLHHLLPWDKMFSPSNEFAPRWCLENTQSSSNGKRDSEGN